ncbi:hypothetical protein CEXT_12121 [Caerostris extrusa]|uniref:Uncharacterized protein n=1 Tax=Caerostris extrusa TaxID=172846 RepID=A0AAV4QYY4_CAEEX|nr:hypothetical protein CEXT_12121 [Caerostris extrusa]
MASELESGACRIKEKMSRTSDMVDYFSSALCKNGGETFFWLDPRRSLPVSSGHRLNGGLLLTVKKEARERRKKKNIRGGGVWQIERSRNLSMASQLESGTCRIKERISWTSDIEDFFFEPYVEMGRNKKEEVGLDHRRSFQYYQGIGLNGGPLLTAKRTAEKEEKKNKRGRGLQIEGGRNCRWPVSLKVERAE